MVFAVVFAGSFFEVLVTIVHGDSLVRVCRLLLGWWLLLCPICSVSTAWAMVSSRGSGGLWLVLGEPVVVGGKAQVVPFAVSA